MRKKSQLRKKIFCLLITVLLFAPEAWAAADRSDEVNRLTGMIHSGSINKKTEAAKIITRSGFSDRPLFELIRKELEAGYLEQPGNSKHIDLMAWYCKALASSGLAEYKEVLQMIAETTADPKLERYAGQSLAMVDEYAERNTIMADKTYADSGLDAESLKLVNMLKSDMAGLKRDAAKLITRAGSVNPVVYDVVSEELLKGYEKALDKTSVDALAWLCKALAASGDAKHKEALQLVATTSDNPKLVKYAEQAYDSIE